MNLSHRIVGEVTLTKAETSRYGADPAYALSVRRKAWDYAAKLGKGSKFAAKIDVKAWNNVTLATEHGFDPLGTRP